MTVRTPVTGPGAATYGPASAQPPTRSGPFGGPSEPAESRAARLARRRRLITWSVLPVLLALLIAAKLFFMVGAADRAVVAFYANDAAGGHHAADTMAFGNIVERHKAPFARGDAWVVAGDLDQARVAFEQALELAPADSVDSCRIRVNLALTHEKLGDTAHANGDETTAREHWQQVVEITDATPPGCSEPEADGTGQKASEIGARAKAKLDPPENPPPSEPDPQKQQEQQQKQDELDKKTEENQLYRNANGPDGADRPPGGGRGSLPPHAKPW